MTRFLAFLALLPLLALVAAVVMVSRTCPTHASVSRSTAAAASVNSPGLPSAVPSVAPDVEQSLKVNDPDAMLSDTQTRISDPTQASSPSTSSTTSTTSPVASDATDIASTLITPPAPAVLLSSPASPAVEPTQKLELLQLEVSLLRDTNRDLLKAIDALKWQLANAQAEITNLQAMLPVENWPLDPLPAPSKSPTINTPDSAPGSVP